MLIETKDKKIFKSPEYNYTFDKRSGFFARWGKTQADDPKFSNFGPEILDIEVSTICHGINNKPCTHCYKSNTGKGENMSLDTFKTVLNKFPTVTQEFIKVVCGDKTYYFSPYDIITLSSGERIKAKDLDVSHSLNLSEV